MAKQPLPTNMVPVPEERRKDFMFYAIDGAVGVSRTWAQWADYHKKLGQELAKRMREYGGPSTSPDMPPEGGQPGAGVLEHLVRKAA